MTPKLLLFSSKIMTNFCCWLFDAWLATVAKKPFCLCKSFQLKHKIKIFIDLQKKKKNHTKIKNQH